MLNRRAAGFSQKIGLLITLLFFCCSVLAQNSVAFKIKVTDQNQIVIPEVTVVLKNGNQRLLYLTNEEGILDTFITAGKYELELMHIAYQSKVESIIVSDNFRRDYLLSSTNKELKEVFITAQEGKGMSTSSVINRKAMEHLQPSSFSDIMELLPGGLANAPSLTATNKILLREYGTSMSGYNTSSLGVQFMVDDQILNSNMDMLDAVKYQQTVGKGNIGVDGRRSTNGIGVDMRTVPTNDIESVEIIRGIPTVSYGDLTSGLVKITRKSGYTKWQSRIKADGFSKLYYIAKGFEINPSWTINTSVDYLNALSDPRDLYESYQRLATSIRSKKTMNIAGNSLVWTSSLDYNVNIDQSKVDPDTGYLATDSYQNNRQRIAFSNTFDYNIANHPWLKKVKLVANVNQGIEDIDQNVFVQYSGPTAVSIATEQGVNDGFFPELSFVAHTKTEGRPINVNTKLQADLDFNTGFLKHDIEIGADFMYSHNYGRGEMYDVTMPPPNTTTRPRAYKDIPAYQNAAIFIGDRMNWNVNNHNFGLYGGARVSKLLGMDKSYALSHKIYVEPRFIFQWTLPKIVIANRFLQIDITAGYGILYKQPTGNMLYPNKLYKDFTQLNFRPSNQDLQYVNFMTYVDDVTNKNLVAAKNTKKELRLDFSYANHNFFITYFDEYMPQGFRSETFYKTYAYKRYDASGLDIPSMTEKPVIEELPYEDKISIIAYSVRKNGSSTLKRGIEFGYTSPRFSEIDTRFTLSGAWFSTEYANYNPIHEKPNVSLAGSDYPYVGIYKSDDGNKISGLNYNLIIDTNLEALDMNVSMSLQGVLFKDDTRMYKEAKPIAYYGADGVIHPYLESDKDDAFKQWLILSVSTTYNMDKHYTFDVRANLKVTKRIFKQIKASLFVNKMFSYMSPYTFNNTKVYRKDASQPYFGMELTYNF